MNIVNKLTLRHMRLNKRRTLVTIIGVIISVAMVTAVATLGFSFADLVQRQTIADEGEWHVLYSNVNKDQLEAIKQDEDTKHVALSRDIGYAYLEGGQNKYKPYLFVKEYDAQGFKQFPVYLSEGRLPQATGEVLLSEHIATNGKVKYKIGDTITLDIGNRMVIDSDDASLWQLEQDSPLQTDEEGENREWIENPITQTFTVVGFMKRPTWEYTWAPGYTILTYMDESLMSKYDLVHASVVLKKVSRSLYGHAEQIAEENNISSVSFNNNLLRFYGITNNDGLNKMLISVSAVIMAVIMIGSVSLIYNAFAISVSERSRHLGMLSSVGATKRQKRHSVFFEGAVIGLISIPIGIVGGLVGIGITFWYINSIIQGALGLSEKLHVVVTPMSILISCLVSLLTIFISTYIPARKASKISAIDAIRQATDIKLTGKAVKTSKLVRKFFGMEAEIGLKNLKRNKRRYKATVFSLVISILLFLTVSYFTDNLKKAYSLTLDGANYDISISIRGGDASEEDNRILQSFANLPDVTESNIVKESFLYAWIPEAMIADKLKEVVQQAPELLQDGKFRYGIQLIGINDEYLAPFARQIGVDPQKLHDPNRLSAIIVDTVPYRDKDVGKYVETKAIHAKIGQSIDLFNLNREKQEDVYLDKIEIVGLTDQVPMGIHPGGIDRFNVIVSETVLKKLVEHQVDLNLWSYSYLKSSDPLKTQEQIEESKANNMFVYNIYQNRQRDEQMILILSVFTYGFIVLITLISIANIFNTISTSVALRKREFAMLKSVGMTPKSFNKMLNYESIFYGVKSLLYGLPISFAAMVLIYKSLMNGFSYGFILPWMSILIVIATVFVIVGASMLYSSAKVKKENIIEALRQESI